MKKMLSVFLCALMLITLTCCKADDNKNKNEKLSVVAVLFAEYDLAKHVAGDYADVSMLLPPGSESHSYDPTPKDIILIENADVFVCTGGKSDSWIDTILTSSKNSDITVLKMMEICEAKEEETVEGMQEEKGELGDEIEYDEHVWTSPKNAMIIIDAITKTLCEKDPNNADSYLINSEKYKSEINELHNEFLLLRENAVRNEIIFADRFPFRYFADEYNLKYYAAFPGCSGESEPSAGTVRFLIDKVRSDEIPCVFTIEFSNKAIAYAISDETGARILQFHSCHNVTKEEFSSGVTYVSLMRQNLNNLKEALS